MTELTKKVRIDENEWSTTTVVVVVEFVEMRRLAYCYLQVGTFVGDESNDRCRRLSDCPWCDVLAFAGPLEETKNAWCMWLQSCCQVDVVAAWLYILLPKYLRNGHVGLCVSGRMPKRYAYLELIYLRR